MSQQDILNVLLKEDKFMTSREIAEILGINMGNASLLLNKLLKQGLVRRIPVKISPVIFGSGAKPYQWKIK